MRASLDYVRAMPPKKTPAPKVNFNTQLPFNELDIEDVVRAAGPSATAVFSKILENSNGASVIDLASGFNNLEPKYRRECEVAGMLSALSKPKNVEGIKSLKTTPKISALKAAFLATLRLIDLEFDGQETPRAARFVAVSAVCERMSLSDGPLSEVGSEQAREEKVKQLFKWAEGIKLVSASEGNKWRICEALAIAVDRTQASLWAQGSAEAESGLEQSTENETASESGI